MPLSPSHTRPVHRSLLEQLPPALRPARAPRCPSRLGCDLHNLHRPEFLAGAAAFLVLAVAVSVVARRRSGQAGLLLAAATVVALGWTGHLTVNLVVALAVLSTGALGGTRLTKQPVVRMALLMPGAVLLGFGTDLVNPTWVRVLVVIAAAGGGQAIASVDRRSRGCGVSPILLGISVAGMYEAAPDPTLPLALFGAAAAMVAVTLIGLTSGVGRNGAPLAAGLLAWMAALGGTGRQAAALGGIACLGILAVEPVTAFLDRKGGLASAAAGSRRAQGALVLVQGAVVYVASRVAGVGHGLPWAVAVVLSLAAVLVVAAITWGVLARGTAAGRRSVPGRSLRSRGRPG